MKKRLICGCLCLLLAVQLCGCVALPGVTKLAQLQQTAAEELQNTPETPETPEPPEQTQPEPAENADAPERPDGPLAFSGYYPYAHPAGTERLETLDSRVWTLAEFEPLAQAMVTAAEAGKTQAFHRACEECRLALADIATASALADIRNCADSADEAAAQAYSDAEGVYYDALDSYCAALHEIAVSGARKMLNWEFDKSYIDYFASYDPEAAESDNALAEKELEMELQYEALMAERRPDYDAVCQLYADLVHLRREIARQAGYDSYADYAYDYTFSRDYLPAQAESIWKMAREQFVPLLQEYADAVYDASDDIMYGSALDCSPEAVLQAVELGASHMSPELLRSAQALREQNLCDIAVSERKLDIGFTSYLYSYDLPFIFNDASGTVQDYLTTFHEFGHFNSFYYNGSDPIFGVSDYDLSELQSQGMEIMFLPWYEEIFGAQNADVLRARTVADLLYAIVEGAMYDEFQQRIYAEPALTAARVTEIFTEVFDSYGRVRYAGFETEWMQIVHNFEYPFYYISYAVSAIPALELLAAQQDDPAEAMDAYLRVSAMSDEDYYLSEALTEIGLGSVFQPAAAEMLCTSLRSSGILDVK